MVRFTRFLLTLMLAGATVSPAAALAVTLDPGVGVSTVGRQVCISVPLCYSTVSVPTGPAPAVGQVSSIIPVPDYEAQVDYALTDASLMFDFLTSRRDVIDQAAGVSAEIFFQLDESAGYDLSASYSLIDPSAGFASVVVRLEDLTSATVLYSYGFSILGIDLAFDLAAPGPYATVSGSTSGLLLTGHEYRLFFDVLSVTDPFDGGGDGSVVAAGTGGLLLAFVPEPGGLVPWLLGSLPFLAVGVGRRLGGSG